jgi:hypothetical protein
MIVWYSLLMLLQTRKRRPSVVNRRGDRPTLESRAAVVCNGIEVGKPIVARSKEAPTSLMREKMRRNIQPLLGPKPWRIHKKILKSSAGVYTTSSMIEMSFRLERVMTDIDGIEKIRI